MFHCDLFTRCSEIRALRLGVVLCILSAVPFLSAADLSEYRAFHFGMELPRAAQAGDMRISDAKVIHQRPALIQELTWRPERTSSDSISDPVNDVVLSFYNGELFRMTVEYDWYKTRGMTTKDMIEAISAVYGTAARPGDEMAVTSSPRGSLRVVARWEDSQYLYNLMHSGDQPMFFLTLLSKRLDALASSAMVEAVRMDAQEAPQRELDRRKQQADNLQLELEKARSSNKPKFRP
jgi:hypothetical protein